MPKVHLKPAWIVLDGSFTISDDSPLREEHDEFALQVRRREGVDH